MGPQEQAIEPQTVTLRHLDDTERYGALVAATLRPGDCLLLDGDLGAGKTALARAMIRPLLTVPEDIPSPTFTLVQTYITPRFEIWHCDLYRLSDPHEVLELGLDGAFETAVTVIEWPDRLGSLTPQGAQRLALAAGATDEARMLTATGDGRWAKLAESWRNDG